MTNALQRIACTVQAAKAFQDKYLEFLRALVKIIEDGGGGRRRSRVTGLLAAVWLLMIAVLYGLR